MKNIPRLYLIAFLGFGGALSTRSTARGADQGAGAAISSLVSGILGEQAGDTVAISSRVSKDYVRTKLRDGTYKPEAIVFGKGGFVSGPLRDSSIDSMGFLAVARTIQRALATQQYYCSTDPKKTKLLLMLYWGTTNPPVSEDESPEMTNLDMQLLEEENRSLSDAESAEILGYDSWWERTAKFADRPWDPGAYLRQDMLDELEEPRYFVVVMAYDFQLLWHTKKAKLLWETRFSFREVDHAFSEDLGAMAERASAYFGQDSHGLTHQTLPRAEVEIGPLKIIDDTKPGAKAK